MHNSFFFHVASATCKQIGNIAELKVPARLLKPFIKAYSLGFRVNTDEALLPEGGFRCFGDFFARQLKEHARPIDADNNSFVSPSDGYLEAIHYIREDCSNNFFVKGYNYNIAKLTGDADVGRFSEGGGLVIYLHPRDYHRVHCPFDMELYEVRHIPGTRYPVASWAEKRVEGIFEKNERLVFNFRKNDKMMSLIMVAAFGVGNMTSPFAPDFKAKEHLRVYDEPISINKGDDIGAFRLGSTVVMLWSQSMVELSDSINWGKIRFGQKLGTVD